MRRPLIALGTACAASGALGQNQGTWLWEVTTQNGDAIVEPGETATVSLWMDMEPSVGEKLPDGFTVVGYGMGIIDVIGGDNAAMGQILGWEVNPTLDLIGMTGTTDGVSIFDVNLGQIPLDPFDSSDPIFLLTFEWQPLEVGEYDALYSLLIEDPLDEIPGMRIWKATGLDNVITEHWPVEPAHVPITVVPAPGIFAPAAIGLLFRRRRKRSTHHAYEPLAVAQSRQEGDSLHARHLGSRACAGGH
jgi:hypothetical protein